MSAIYVSSPISIPVVYGLGLRGWPPSKAQMKTMRRIAKALVFTTCLLPLAWLVWDFFQGQLGANPNVAS